MCFLVLQDYTPFPDRLSPVLLYFPLCIIAVFGVLAIVCFVNLVRSLNARSQVELRVYWGGFGGSGTGWRVSDSLTYFLLTVLFTLTCAAAGIYQARTPPARDRETKASGAEKSPSKAPTDLPAPSQSQAPVGSPK